MKWIKHDTDANQDNKLQNVLLDYGLEGYGLYWYCIELIGSKVDKDNITFELEHDARVIARNVGSTAQKVEEMMRYFVKQGLFEQSDNIITCIAMAKRLDKSMTSNPQMRNIIENIKSHDAVMIESAKPMQDKIRLDKNRKDTLVTPKRDKKKFNFNQDHFNFAQAMFEKIKNVAPASKEPNLENWANTIRLLCESDEININYAWNVFKFANSDPFWQTNILSADKFRKQFAQLSAKMPAPQKQRIIKDFKV